MVEINRNACTGCGQCMSDCIANNLFLREGKAEVSGNCILCGHCVAVCPLNAVSIPEYDMGDVEELSQEQAGLDSDRQSNTGAACEGSNRSLSAPGTWICCCRPDGIQPQPRICRTAALSLSRRSWKS